MIECSAENIWYKKKNIKHKKRRFKLIFFILIMTGILLYGRFVVAVNLTRICENYAYSYATESVNEAILNSLGDTVKYSELIKIEKDNSGDIVLMTTDSFKVNYVNREIVKYTQANLKEKLRKGIPIPLFAFTGLDVISGIGVPIYLNIISVVSVESDFSSDFESVGINQTLHSIYITVSCQVKIHIPLYTKTKEVKTRILLSEAILVGKVPDIYLKGTLFN